jgi:hypothetical protein
MSTAIYALIVSVFSVRIIRHVMRVSVRHQGRQRIVVELVRVPQGRDDFLGLTTYVRTATLLVQPVT